MICYGDYVTGSRQLKHVLMANQISSNFLNELMEMSSVYLTLPIFLFRILQLSLSFFEFIGTEHESYAHDLLV